MIIWAIYGEFNLKNIIINTILVIFKPIIYIGEAIKLLYNNIFKRNKIKGEGKIQEAIKESKVFKQILLGLVISIPLLIVILALLISADEVFAQILEPIKEFLGNIVSIRFWISSYFRIIVFVIVFPSIDFV